MCAPREVPDIPISLPRRLAIVMGLCAVLPTIAHAQVTYFQRPPTPEQLRAARLAPGAPPAASPAAAGQRATPSAGGTRTRGIVWQSAGSPASPPPAAAPSNYQPAPSSYQPVAAPSYQSAAQAIPVQTSTANAATASPSPGSALMETAASGGASPAAALPINFDSGSSRVDRDSMPYIETIASLMRSDPSLQLVIEGHTDARGAYNRNMVLSWDRALGVFRTLVETYGVEPRRLQPVGKGPLEPMPGTDPGDGSNRRVQFRVNG